MAGAFFNEGGVVVATLPDHAEELLAADLTGRSTGE
jgi:hypothetical protein